MHVQDSPLKTIRHYQTTANSSTSDEAGNQTQEHTKLGAKLLTMAGTGVSTRAVNGYSSLDGGVSLC